MGSGRGHNESTTHAFPGLQSGSVMMSPFFFWAQKFCGILAAIVENDIELNLSWH
jgi:hypothetical protein